MKQLALSLPTRSVLLALALALLVSKTIVRADEATVAPLDDERAPAHDDSRSSRTFLARLTLGFEGAAWVGHGAADIHEPFVGALDLGYFLTRRLVLDARYSTELLSDAGFEVIGVGLTHVLSTDDIAVTWLVGGALFALHPGLEFGSSAWFQGLAAQLSAVQPCLRGGEFALGIGAQLELVTPWLSDRSKIYGVGVALVLALSYG